MKKSKTRLFVDKKLSPNIMIYIRDKQHHFLKNVLRANISDVVMLCDNETGEWHSSILSINRKNIVLKVTKKIREINNESDIWLAFSPIKEFRLNIVIQKATELGVSKIIPCKTNFTNNHFLNYRNLKLNIIEAAEQCDRLTLPSLEKLTTLNILINNHPKDRALLFCDETKESRESIFESINKIRNNYKKWTILIGPEGGFSEKEINEIEKLPDCFSVSLGSRILRSDTAVTSALFCLQSIIESG